MTKKKRSRLEAGATPGTSGPSKQGVNLGYRPGFVDVIWGHPLFGLTFTPEQAEAIGKGMIEYARLARGTVQ